MKKILSSLLVVFFLFVNLGYAAFANGTNEHISQPKKVLKKTPTDLVTTSAEKTTVLQYNVVEVTFAHNFTTKTAQIGDEVKFLLNDGLKTQEGTQILPQGTILVSEIIGLQKPKSFNRSGKVLLQFKYFETPSGEQLPVKAKIFSKKDFLYRGKMNAWGKGFSSTLGGMAIGTGIGCGVGAAVGAVVIGGLAIGLPVGLAVGAVVGYVTPGVHYKAKAGDKLLIQFTDNLEIVNPQVEE